MYRADEDGGGPNKSAASPPPTAEARRRRCPGHQGRSRGAIEQTVAHMGIMWARGETHIKDWGAAQCALCKMAMVTIV